MGLTQIALKQFASRTVTQASDRLLLNLADPLAGKTEVLTYLLQRHLLGADSKEVFYDIPLTLGKG